MKTLSLLILMAIGLGLVGTAIAQPESSVPALAIPGEESTQLSARVVLALGFLSMLIGAVSRWAFAQKWEFWDTKAGGYTIAGVLGVAALIAGVVEAGGFSIDNVFAALTVTLAAMGMHGPAKGLAQRKSADDSLQNV